MPMNPFSSEDALSAADILNLEEMLSYKNQYGEFVQFIELLKAYGRWGFSGVLPRSLQCPSKDVQRSFAISTNMMLMVERCVLEQRHKLSEAMDLYFAFKLEYLTPPAGDEYEAVLKNYKAALRERSKLYSIRGRQRDSAAFVKRLRNAMKEGIKNFSI